MLSSSIFLSSHGELLFMGDAFGQDVSLVEPFRLRHRYRRRPLADPTANRNVGTHRAFQTPVAMFLKTSLNCAVVFVFVLEDVAVSVEKTSSIHANPA